MAVENTLGDEVGYDPFYAYVIVILVAIIIILTYCMIMWYTQRSGYNANDGLNKYLNKITGMGKQTWMILHLSLFTLLGLLYPTAYPVIYFGILWELIEYGLSGGNGKLGFEAAPICRYDSNSNKVCTKFWYSCFIDCIINSVGFFIGVSLNHSFSSISSHIS